jgi:hypothetical protein
LDVQLGPRLHVYAPGVNSDYIPIDWSMKESPAILVRTAVYPTAKMLRLEAIRGDGAGIRRRIPPGA